MPRQGLDRALVFAAALELVDRDGLDKLTMRRLAADLGVEADRAGTAGSRTTVSALHDPPSRGDTLTIEDDGTAAEKVLEYLVERKLI